MLYLACYDIESNRERLRIANHLLDLGYERIQKSVFVGLQNPEERSKLQEWLNANFGHKLTGGFVLIPLSQTSAKDAWHLGKTPPDWEYLSNKTETLIY